MGIEYINIGGISVRYSAKGRGKDVLFLHGWGSDLSSFSSAQDLLALKYKTYSIDFPGFGNSDEPDKSWGTEEYCQFVIDLMDALGINNPVVVGHSFGGRVAIRIAALGKAQKLILVNSAGIRPVRSIGYYVKVISYKIIKKIFHFAPLSIVNTYKSRAGSPDYRNASNVMKKVLVNVVNEDMRDLLSRINIPVLLVWGEEDQVTPLYQANVMNKLIPDSGLVVLKKAGHFSHIENRNDFELVVGSFLGVK